MRVGIEIRHIVEQGTITPLLVEQFDALCQGASDYEFHFFGTIFNRSIFQAEGPNVHRYSLPLDCYWARLEALLVREKIDVLFRSSAETPLKFPLQRQVCFIAKLPSDELSQPRTQLLDLIQGCGAVVTATEHSRQLIQKDCSNRSDEIFILPRLPDHFPSVERGVASPECQASLRAVLERVHRKSVRLQVRERAPLVSIVTPSLNQGRFIGRTIDSVLCQSYPNIEYHVIDGSSTDETREVLESYGDRLSWVSEPDRGQANAINKGLAKSKGEILSYLNSDDTINPRAVETVVDLFRKNPHVSMLYGDANYIDVDDQIIRPYRTAEYSFEQLMQYCCVCQPAAFWTAEIARQIGPLDEKLHFAMDYDYWLRMAKSDALIVHVPVVLANSRIYPETKTMSKRPRIYDEIFEVCLRHGGYVSDRWIRGRLRCRLDEERHWLSRLIANVLGQPKALFEYYSLRFGRSRLSVLSALLRVMRRGLGFANFGDRRRNKDSKVPSERSRGRATAASCKIAGLSPDGHLLAKSRFRSHNTRSRQLLRVTGIPVVDTRVEIRTGEELILSRSLEAEREATLEFEALGGDVKITFDAFQRAKDGRKLAFRLTGTNLFSEQELNQSAHGVHGGQVP